MTPRFILITTAAILLAGCDRRSAEADAAKAAEIAQQRQAELAANDKVRQLEERLNAADQLKASEREAELARVKEELAQVKRDKDAAAERIRDLQSEANKPAPPPIAEAPARSSVAPRPEAIRADLERVVEEDDEDDNVPESDPVYVGRVVPETQRVTNVESFYEPLDRYGDWIQTDDYGYVFRPEAARRHDWRPYTDGRWAHSGHGWTWESNEDFGWATYHYGRWTRVERAGWVWVPGREWGPGWVSWRRGKEECGWAPLPPESRGRHSFTATVDRDYDIGPAAYVFIAMSNFGARSYAPVIERPERNVAIINQTVNVTNITYNNTTNNTVVYNGGPNYDVVRAHSKQPVENVKVNFVPQAPAGDRGKIANLRQGNNFQIAAPPTAVAANTAPPRVKERLGKAQEDKGWKGVDPAQAQKVKQEIAATSTDRPRRPRPAAGVANPARPNGAVPGVTVPPTTPARPVRPVVATPEATKPPVDPATPAPRPNASARPAVVDKPRPLDPDAARPKPAAEVLPKVEKPDDTKKPAGNEPPKTQPEPVRPKPAAEVPPKLDRPDNTPPRRVREIETPATPQAARVRTQRDETPATPVVRERPKAPVSPEAPVRQRVEPPARVKPPVEAPARIRPTPAPAPRQPQVERRQIPAPERTAPVSRPVVQQPPPPVRRVVQPERPPQEAIPRPRENVQRPQAPVVQRQPQQPVVQRQPQGNPQQPAAEEAKRKKKKDGEQ